MSASFPRLIARGALLTVLVASAASSFGQIPAASSARNIPNEVEQSEPRIAQIIAKAEDGMRRMGANSCDEARTTQAGTSGRCSAGATKDRGPASRKARRTPCRRRPDDWGTSKEVPC